MSLGQRLAHLRDRIIYGRAALRSLREAEAREAELQRFEAECEAQKDEARSEAHAKIVLATTEMRRTPPEQPRSLWPTPGEQPPVPYTPRGPGPDK